MEEKKGFFSYNCIEIGVPEEPIVKIGEVVIIKKEEFDKMEYCLNLFTEAKDWYWNIASLYDTKNKFEEFSVQLKKMMEEGVHIFSLNKSK